MNRIFAAVLAASTIPSWSVLADEATSTDRSIPADHSMVRVVFVVPVEPNKRPVAGGKPVPMASAGSVVVPYDLIRPVSIRIDQEFVGHALFGYEKVSPVFILRSGKRQFSFACEGYEPVQQELHVLGTGSTQFLIVKMRRLSPGQGKSSSVSAVKVQGNTDVDVFNKESGLRAVRTNFGTGSPED